MHPRRDLRAETRTSPPVHWKKIAAEPLDLDLTPCPGTLLDDAGNQVACRQASIQGRLTGCVAWIRSVQTFATSGRYRLHPPADGALCSLRIGDDRALTRPRGHGPQQLELHVSDRGPLRIEVEYARWLPWRQGELAWSIGLPSACEVNLLLDEVPASLRANLSMDFDGRHLRLQDGARVGPDGLKMLLGYRAQTPRAVSYENRDDLLLALYPPEQLWSACARDVVVCLGPGTEHAYRPVADFLESLGPEDRFGIMAQGRLGPVTFQEVVPATVDRLPEAREWLLALAGEQQQSQDEPPDLEPAVQGCLGLLANPARFGCLVLVLAEPLQGLEAACLEALIATSLSPRTFVVVERPDPCSRRVAEVSRGEMLVGPTSECLRELECLIAEPLLSEPVLMGTGMQAPADLVYPERLPDLYRDRPIFALARRHAPGVVRMHALEGDRVWEQALNTVATDNPGLAVAGALAERRRQMDRAALGADVAGLHGDLELGLLTSATEWKVGKSLLRLDPQPPPMAIPREHRRTALESVVPALLKHFGSQPVALTVEMGLPVVRPSPDQDLDMVIIPWHSYLPLTAELLERSCGRPGELYDCLPDSHDAVQVVVTCHPYHQTATLQRLERDVPTLVRELSRRRLGAERYMERLESRAGVRRWIEQHQVEPELALKLTRPQAERLGGMLVRRHEGRVVVAVVEPNWRTLAHLREMAGGAELEVDSHERALLQQVIDWLLGGYAGLHRELERAGRLVRWGAPLAPSLAELTSPLPQMLAPGWDFRIHDWLGRVKSWCDSQPTG